MLGLLGISLRDAALVAAALAFCVGVFVLDTATTSDITEAFLYALAFGIVYPVKRDGVTAMVVALGLFFTVLAGLLEPEGESDWGGMVNRANSMAVMIGVGLLMWKIAHVERRLFRLSTADPLTGAYNRRHFLHQMEAEQKRAERYETSFSLLMLDIDHFKTINDTFGHQVGDEAIKAMAATCQRFLRPTDMLCRYGGEEFIVSLPHTDEAGAVVAGERIREAIAQVELAAEGKTVRFTVSIGVATFQRRSRLDQVIEAADQALYAAKQSGRNRVRVARLGSGVVAAA